MTEIETWLRDPYAIYARHVLGLRPLDALDEPIGPLERGTALHKAVERFIDRYRADCRMMRPGSSSLSPIRSSLKPVSQKPRWRCGGRGSWARPKVLSNSSGITAPASPIRIWKFAVNFGSAILP